MQKIDLRYGQQSLTFNFDPGRFEVLGHEVSQNSLNDVELGNLLDTPIGSKAIEEIIDDVGTVLIVVPDATRRTAAGQIVNLIVRRLIANGTEPHKISIIFATGIHRKVTDAEKAAILTPFIAQRIKTIDHHPRDLMQIVRLGETSAGIPIELDRALLDHEHVIICGGVSFHYFAGFTGGRKLICPGLASSRTISETHKLAFDFEKKDRRAGVGTGLLDGNAVHESFVEVVEHAAPAFAVSTITNENGDASAMFCGDWKDSHRAACDAFAADHLLTITERREVVIASCGGYPHDVNLIQAHKALDAAAKACVPGGKIYLVAECSEGLGRADLLDWFDVANSGELAEKLCNKYQVNGQTAWSLLKKAEEYDIGLITSIDVESLKKMRLRSVEFSELQSAIDSDRGYILPNGAKFAVKTA